MKKLFSLLFLVLLFSCEKEGELTKNANNTVISPNAVLLYHGDFVATSGINVTGKAKIFHDNNQNKLELSEFSISEGPDLKVYLSKSNSPNEFVTIGNLTSGRVYTIPSQINLEEYSHVLIHCQEYNHLFAIAELIKN
jgi:hypothetical protein